MSALSHRYDKQVAVLARRKARRRERARSQSPARLGDSPGLDASASTVDGTGSSSKRLKRLQREYEKLRTENRQLELRLAGATRTGAMAELVNRSAALDVKLRQLEAENDGLKQVAKQQQEGKAEADSRGDVDRERVEVLKEEVQLHKQELRDVQESVRLLSEEVAPLTRQYASLSDKRDRLQQRLRRCRRPHSISKFHSLPDIGGSRHSSQRRRRSTGAPRSPVSDSSGSPRGGGTDTLRKRLEHIQRSTSTQKRRADADAEQIRRKIKEARRETKRVKSTLACVRASPRRRRAERRLTHPPALLAAASSARSRRSCGRRSPGCGRSLRR